MLLVALRYIFAVIPAIAFVKCPAVGWRYIVVYGMTVGVGQFACLFYAMNIGMQVIGLLTAGLGLYFIGRNIGSNGLFSIPLVSFLLTLLGAAFWGISNIIVRYASEQSESHGKKLDMLSLVV